MKFPIMIDPLQNYSVLLFFLNALISDFISTCIVYTQMENTQTEFINSLIIIKLTKTYKNVN